VNRFVICTSAPGAPANLFLAREQAFAHDLGHAAVFHSLAACLRHIRRYYPAKEGKYFPCELTDDGRLPLA
jgi:hypothetical protein